MVPNPTETYWRANDDGDLVRVGEGQEYWANIALSANCFPLDVNTVTHLLNSAFQQGLSAKQSELKQVLGVT